MTKLGREREELKISGKVGKRSELGKFLLLVTVISQVSFKSCKYRQLSSIEAFVVI
jgi:hypothetical protein